MNLRREKVITYKTKDDFSFDLENIEKIFQEPQDKSEDEKISLTSFILANSRGWNILNCFCSISTSLFLAKLPWASMSLCIVSFRFFISCPIELIFISSARIFSSVSSFGGIIFGLPGLTASAMHFIESSL